MLRRPTLIIMARWPAPGRCKSRLAKSIGVKKAAKVQAMLFDHTIAVAKKVAQQELVELQLAICGLSPNTAKRWGAFHGLPVITRQGTGSLGVRMKKQVLFAQKIFPTSSRTTRPTILIGTDLPNLCSIDLVKAIEALETNEMVIGPANDGGYWLLGLTGELVNPVKSWPFCGIPWGTNQVLKKTLLKAKQKQAKLVLLPCQNDLDSIEDISPWKA